MIPNGTITIESPRGGHRTFRIRTQPDDAKFAPGKRILSLLVGPDNGHDYKGFAFISYNRYVDIWRSKLGAMFDGKYKRSDWEWYGDMIIRQKDWEEKGYRYLVTKNCQRCNRKLTTPESLTRGVGPECAKMMGVA